MPPAGRRPPASGAVGGLRGRDGGRGDLSPADAHPPADETPANLSAVPVAGSPPLSRASGYNLAGRPPVAAVRDGIARLLVRRESMEDIRSRDVGL